MGKIDFDRHGLDFPWAAFQKTDGLSKSGYSKQLNPCSDSATSSWELPLNVRPDGEHNETKAEHATSSEQLALPSPAESTPQVAQVSLLDNDTHEDHEDKEMELAGPPLANDSESHVKETFAAASDDVKDQLSSSSSQDKDAGTDEKESRSWISSTFACCFDGVSKMLQPGDYNTSRMSLHQDPDDAEMTRVLFESASLHEARDSSIALARVRLQESLDLHNAKSVPVEADGNCQFRALCQQFYGNESQHDALRKRVVDHLEKMPERYCDFVLEPWRDYIKRLSRSCEWGDNVTLQAASDLLGVEIRVLNDQPGAEEVRVTPMEPSKDSKGPLWLAFLAEVHYDGVEFISC